uniref:protein-tyrosine-phosphatase n=1 Tax=Setaria digitata TaxID=48799 RepID=A0A915PLY7_9BILA
MRIKRNNAHCPSCKKPAHPTERFNFHNPSGPSTSYRNPVNRSPSGPAVKYREWRIAVKVGIETAVMEQLIEMYDEIEDNHLWNSVYQEIDRQSCKQEKQLKLTTKVAHSWENVERNRYRNVLAYDTSRVILKRVNSEGSDYINASALVVPSARRNYILTQGPLSTTSNDFWQMIWEQNSTLIIMLNKLVEKGLTKCHDYFPSFGNPVREFDSFNVVLKEEQDFDDYVVRDLELSWKTGNILLEKDGCSGSLPRIIKHFHFISWPDFGVPHSTTLFIEFLQKVRETGLLSGKEPTVVHCSAGIGRSGTFVVADSVLSMVEQNMKKIDVTNLVVQMRKSRMGLIQTPQQLQFCWKTIVDALRQGVITKNMKLDDGKFVNDKWGRNLLAVSNSHINGEVDEVPHFERSQANQMTTDLHSKSCSDLSVFRKRASTDSYETNKETKQARRKKRIERMRARLLKCEDARKKWHNVSIGRTSIGYTCAAVAVAFAIYCIYRLTS